MALHGRGTAGGPTLYSRRQALHSSPSRTWHTTRPTTGLLDVFSPAPSVPGTTQAIGQPTPETHPHLMTTGEVTPGITAAEYALRRRKLLERLPAESIAVAFGHRLQYKATHVFYPFHQNSDFLYLTGFNEPDAILLLEKSDRLPGGSRQCMFVLPKDPEAEKWEGPRAGVEGVQRVFGSYEGFPYAQFASEMAATLAHAAERGGPEPVQVYADLPPDYVMNSPQHTLTTLLDQQMISAVKLSPLVQQLRLIKSPAELALMQAAADITSEAFRAVMRTSSRSRTEHDVYTTFAYHCGQRGAEELAYVPVVAGGANALSLHYIQNNQRIAPTDLILLDGGASYRHYASDVTRTWPVGGIFSDPQAELYRAVLNVQKECVAMCTEISNMSLNEIHWASTHRLQRELAALGWDITRQDITEILYPHHIGHYLGLDVHDILEVTRNLKLKQGMVVTIEPGIYVPHDKRFPAKYQGIGIRIEDNVAIGKTVPQVLSRDAPKEIDEITLACHRDT
ncbi:aminopeptidase [Tieghemiomyces parasiticus]|uniref:Aminopeptidase n=1 Tax=Tieghemiomyces parasiticus TaxID=78921 RepID=A0A9W7ZQ66_9FUNG|nr:aminopeptidase [Tieghemiomyces parasiticus]